MVKLSLPPPVVGLIYAMLCVGGTGPEQNDGVCMALMRNVLFYVGQRDMAALSPILLLSIPEVL